MEALRLPGRDASAALYGRGDTEVVLGHGAGGNRRSPFLVAPAEAVARTGRAARFLEGKSTLLAWLDRHGL